MIIINTMIIRRDQQGILSADFLLSFFILIILIIGILNITFQRLDMVNTSEDLIEARLLADKISIALNQAYSGGNGTDILVTLPAVLNQKNYQVMVNSSGVYVKIGGKKGKAPIIPQKISNSYNLHENTVYMEPGKTYLLHCFVDSNGVIWLLIL